jgi:hypothetical protein
VWSLPREKQSLLVNNVATKQLLVHFTCLKFHTKGPITLWSKFFSLFLAISLFLFYWTLKIGREKKNISSSSIYRKEKQIKKNLSNNKNVFHYRLRQKLYSIWCFWANQWKFFESSDNWTLEMLALTLMVFFVKILPKKWEKENNLKTTIVLFRSS